MRQSKKDAEFLKKLSRLEEALIKAQTMESARRYGALIEMLIERHDASHTRAA